MAAMGGGKPDDLLVVLVRDNLVGDQLQYTAGDERLIVSTREQCEYLLKRYKQRPSFHLPSDGKAYQWLCDSLPSVPGSPKPHDGLGT